MKHTIDIRELMPSDAALYKSLRVEAAADPAFGMSPERERAYSRALLEQVLGQDDGSRIYGAFDGQDLLGMVGFGRGMKKRTGTLFGLFVRDSRRSQGLGRRLCVALISNHPGVAIRLEVRADNLPAVDLYQSLGFIRSGNDGVRLVMIRPPHAETTAS